jgi:hypothetical protein
VCGNSTKKSNAKTIASKNAGFKRVFSKNRGGMPKEKSTTISLSLERRKSDMEAAMKNVIGNV